MSKVKKSKSPKVSPQLHPQSREVRFKAQPISTETETPAWQFHRCDTEHELWGWKKLLPEDRVKMIQQLCSFERITWADLKKQSGGRTIGTNHHSLKIEGFAKKAQKRLQELKLDDFSEIFSLRLTNTLRLYGIREGRVLKFIWHDPHHGTDNGAYPTGN